MLNRRIFLSCSAVVMAAPHCSVMLARAAANTQGRKKSSLRFSTRGSRWTQHRCALRRQELQRSSSTIAIAEPAGQIPRSTSMLLRTASANAALKICGTQNSWPSSKPRVRPIPPSHLSADYMSPYASRSTGDGWLNRALTPPGPTRRLCALSSSVQAARTLRGDRAAIAVANDRTSAWQSDTARLLERCMRTRPTRGWNHGKTLCPHEDVQSVSNDRTLAAAPQYARGESAQPAAAGAFIKADVE